jgi:hypothetical protein
MKTKTSYTIDEHPEPDAVFKWIRDNWHDLNEHGLEDAVNSLKAFAEYYGLSLDYSMSQVPDRGEFIRFTNVPDDFQVDAKHRQGNCALTGMYYDEELFEVFREDNNAESISDIEHNILKAVHDETEYLYSDEALREDCEANEWHFFESGEFHE